MMVLYRMKKGTSDFFLLGVVMSPFKPGGLFSSCGMSVVAVFRVAYCRVTCEMDVSAEQLAPDLIYKSTSTRVLVGMV